MEFFNIFVCLHLNFLFEKLLFIPKRLKGRVCVWNHWFSVCMCVWFSMLIYGFWLNWFLFLYFSLFWSIDTEIDPIFCSLFIFCIFCFLNMLQLRNQNYRIIQTYVLCLLTQHFDVFFSPFHCGRYSFQVDDFNQANGE